MPSSCPANCPSTSGSLSHRSTSGRTPRLTRLPLRCWPEIRRRSAPCPVSPPAYRTSRSRSSDWVAGCRGIFTDRTRCGIFWPPVARQSAQCLTDAGRRSTTVRPKRLRRWRTRPSGVHSSMTSMPSTPSTSASRRARPTGSIRNNDCCLRSPWRHLSMPASRPKRCSVPKPVYSSVLV